MSYKLGSGRAFLGFGLSTPSLPASRTSSKENLPEQIAVTHLIAHQGHPTSRIYRSSQHMNYFEVLPDCRRVHSSAAASFAPNFVYCWLRSRWVFAGILTNHSWDLSAGTAHPWLLLPPGSVWRFSHLQLFSGCLQRCSSQHFYL